MPLTSFHMSTRHLLSLGTALVLLFSLSVARVDACTGNCAINVLFTGNYTEETCEVAVNNGSNNESILLPVLSTRTLQKSGNEAGSRPFDITLKECPASRTINLSFNSSVSAADSTTGNLLNDTGEDFSQNVQLRLRKENGTQIVIDNTSTGQDYVISSTGTPLTHRFSASYYAGNATVSAGKVHAAAGITLVYK